MHHKAHAGPTITLECSQKIKIQVIGKPFWSVHLGVFEYVINVDVDYGLCTRLSTFEPCYLICCINFTSKAYYTERS